MPTWSEPGLGSMTSNTGEQMRLCLPSTSLRGVEKCLTAATDITPQGDTPDNVLNCIQAIKLGDAILLRPLSIAVVSSAPRYRNELALKNARSSGRRRAFAAFQSLGRIMKLRCRVTACCRDLSLPTRLYACESACMPTECQHAMIICFGRLVRSIETSRNERRSQHFIYRPHQEAVLEHYDLSRRFNRQIKASRGKALINLEAANWLRVKFPEAIIMKAKTGDATPIHDHVIITFPHAISLDRQWSMGPANIIKASLSVRSIIRCLLGLTMPNMVKSSRRHQ